MSRETVSVCYTTIICAIIAILTVSGCNTRLSDRESKEISAENRFLIQHYQRYSMQEANKDQWHKAEFFAQKSEHAALNKKPAPTDPRKFLNPSNPYYSEAIALYEEMLPLIKDKRARYYPEKVANVIAHYEYYVIQAEDGKKEKAKVVTYKTSCQEALYALYTALRSTPKAA